MSYLLSDFLSQVSSSIYPLRDAGLVVTARPRSESNFAPTKMVLILLVRGITPQIYTNNQQRRENDPHLASFGHIFGRLLEVIFPSLSYIKRTIPCRSFAVMRCQNGKPKPVIHDATNCSWLEAPCQEMHFTASTCERKIRNQQQKDLSFSTTPWKFHMQPKHGGGWKMTFRLSIGGFWGSMF